MSDAIIRAAIESRLTAWAKAQSPAIPIAYENMGYKPTTGQRFLRGTLMPAGTLNPSLAASTAGTTAFIRSMCMCPRMAVPDHPTH